jgi:Peptidase family M1 domain
MLRRLHSLALLFFLPCCANAADSPHDALAALNALGIDAQSTYSISPQDRIEIRQADVSISLTDGKLAFFQPYEGRITGFVYSGIGHVLALPRDPIEKQQLARFLGAPILDQQFFSGYCRFTDDTAQDLLSQFQRAGITPSPDSALLEVWQHQLERLNPSHSQRILFEKFYSSPRHFFHAGLDGQLTGPFDILLDQSRNENFMLGQPRRAGNSIYYDVWSSYSLPGTHPPQIPFRPVHYHIDTTIRPDNSLEGRTTVDFRAITGSEQILFISLARALKVDKISLADGTALPFFQNEGLTEQQLRDRGDDTLCIFLPQVPATGQSFTININYRGNVISDAGNGVLFVGARESWYPHFGDAAEFVLYDLTIHWPKHLRLVATGDKSDEHEAGDYRVAHWTTPRPVPEAGFNLGEYAVSSLSSGIPSIDLYANRQLEDALLSRLSPRATEPDPNLHFSPSDPRIVNPLASPPSPPRPADALKQLARGIDSSIHYYEQFGGPFPFHGLSVSQIPGAFGQGWPGLLYLSTFSFLPPQVQERAGLTTAGQEQFTDIVPFHEVAHQWWGNVVSWSSYRDQWLDESIASYLSLMFADTQKNSDHPLRAWLERYRKRLTTKAENEDIPPGDAGPLIMGTRLSSSKSTDGYDVIVYSKGPWVIHMLREMLRQPGATNPDVRFTDLLRSISTKYAQSSLSTAQFRSEVEAVMTARMDLEGGRSMEWFFEQYVNGTGIPHYKVEFSSRRTVKGFQIRGILHQTGVPHSFIAPVPLYINAGLGRSVFLGTVVTTGDDTHFSFNTQTDPHKLQIDPHMTLLCVTE